MHTSEQTRQQIERALKKAASKFKSDVEPLPLTDVFLQVKQESGELLVFDDDDNELTRCVVEEWMGNNSENFYEEVQAFMEELLPEMKGITDNFNLIRPYSFMLMGEDKETLAELYAVDDDTIVISGELMEGLSEDLDRFWEELQKKYEK